LLLRLWLNLHDARLLAENFTVRFNTVRLNTVRFNTGPRGGAVRYHWAVSPCGITDRIRI